MSSKDSINVNITDLNRIGTYIYDDRDWCYGHSPTIPLSEEEMISILENYPDSGIIYLLKYDEEFIRKYPDLIPWHWISLRDISEDFIREFKDKVDWENIETRITELCNRGHYSDQIVNHILSDDFVREFSDKFSQEFLDKYLD